MNPALIVIIIVLCIILWFCAGPLFSKIGDFFCLFGRNFSDEDSEKNQSENKKENKK